MKKTASILAALALTAGISGQAFAAEGAASFSDVPEGHWSYGAIDQLVKDGILEGNGDGTFAGDRAMSRYEMAAVIAVRRRNSRQRTPLMKRSSRSSRMSIRRSSQRWRRKTKHATRS